MSINKVLILMALGLALTSCKNIEDEGGVPSVEATLVPHPKPCASDSYNVQSARAVCKLETDDPRVVCFVNTDEGAISCVRVD